MIELNRNRIKVILMFVDSLTILLSGLLAQFILQYYVVLDTTYIAIFMSALIIGYIIIGNFFRIFSKINRYVSIKDLFDIYRSLVIASLISFIITVLLNQNDSYRFLLLVGLFSADFITVIRMAWRLIAEYQRKSRNRLPEVEKRILVVGAGQGGNMFINSIQNQRTDIDIFGVIDNVPEKQNTYLNSVPVIGMVKNIPRIIRENRVDEIIVAIPSLEPKNFEEIIELVNEFGVPVKKMPPVEEVMLGNLTTTTVDVDIVDLLGRDEVKLDTSNLFNTISGRTIFVTGAGGSIGSEIVRQLSNFNPKCILLMGHGENSIYQIHREMVGKKIPNVEFLPIIADVQDRKRLFELMAKHKPQIVFHAAAHKHVPLMEYNPTESVKNNIFGTKNLADAALENGVEKFVMVSTDKANNPTNVMGATKRVAEMIVTGMNGKGKTVFSAVRFGNVLGSRGSVIPVFKEQIAKGGPVTVTDFRMTRYFMTIPEASRLVIQAGSYAKGGELFILDMGEPVRIVDLAKKLIKLSGHQEGEIEIVESGIRPGEKLYEELLLDDETTGEKVFDKIFVGRVNNMTEEEIWNFVNSLDLSGKSDEQISKALIEFVKH